MSVMSCKVTYLVNNDSDMCGDSESGWYQKWDTAPEKQIPKKMYNANHKLNLLRLQN